MQCPTCKGTGKFPDKTKICSVCSGNGKLPNTRLYNPACPICSGSGKYPTQYIICKRCKGWGKLSEPVKKGATVFSLMTDTPRKSYQQLNKIFSKLKGDIRICSPRFSEDSLEQLALLTNCNTVQILTHNIDNKEITRIVKILHDLFYQRPHFEIRKTPDSVLHDKYIISNDELVLLSHGLNDIGERGSFIVQLGRHLSADVINTVSLDFNEKWQTGIALPEQN